MIHTLLFPGTTPLTGAFPLARASLLCLHRGWSDDHAGFAAALASSPALQRRYLWLAKNIDAIKPGLNLRPLWDLPAE